MRTIDFLIDFMKDKETLFLIGEDFANSSNSKTFFNRKTLIKDTENFWLKYASEIKKSDMVDVLNIVSNIPNAKIITTSRYLPLSDKILFANGHKDKNICNICKKEYNLVDALNYKFCPECNKPIYPSTILELSKRTSSVLEDMDNAFNNAKVLFLINVNLDDKDIKERVEKFIDSKKDQGVDTKKVLVVIEEDEDLPIKIEDIGFAEFTVRGPVKESMYRFYNSFTK